MESLFSILELNPWYIGLSNSSLTNYFGARPVQATLNYTAALLYAANSTYQGFSINKSENINGYFGLLGTLEPRLFANTSSNLLSSITYNEVPYEQQIDGISDNDVDTALAALINQVIIGLATLNKTALTAKNVATSDLLKFYASASKVTEIMPYGAIFLDSFDPGSLLARYILHVGTDTRIAAASNFPTQGMRMLTLIAQLGQANFRGLSQVGHRNDTLTQGIRAFPEIDSTAINLPFGGLIGRILYPFGDPLSETQLAMKLEIDASELRFEDADVKAEKKRIELGEYDRASPLVLSHMRKVYPSRKGLGPKFAVKDVSFVADLGTVFGLLGPNGAGKTTLISILTGLYSLSYGNAILAGFDIKNEGSDICQVMGICPQFDILWEDLTIEEHLYFYARLKGATASNENDYVRQALENVSLTSLADRLTKRLSGGEKRRLSIAIALIGQPKVVFLDEPTTGLDPEVRRLIWNIIQKAKEGKTVIL
ncbi:hypothetical protein HK100_001931, partial [Physocladia obscura]